MNNNLTEIVFVLDRSGSMAGLESDTIGGFNSMIAKQKKENGEAYISTVLFDNESSVVYDRVPVEKIEPMNEKQYCVGGGTALLDALGGAVHHIANVHRYAREEDRPGKTIFVITTDGLENASYKYSGSEVKRMIKHEQEKYGWEFLFLGANMDAISEASRYGIRNDRAVRYNNDGNGMKVNFESISCAVSEMRNGRPIKADWKKDIENDFNFRSGKI